MFRQARVARIRCIAGGLVIFGAIVMGGQALARGVIIDQNPPPSLNPCTLGSGCAANNFNQVYEDFGSGPEPTDPSDFNLGVFGKVYVYDDGVISIGQALPIGASVVGGLGSLGGNYIAVGFADLASLNANKFAVVGTINPQSTPDGNGQEAGVVNVEWIFDTPGKEAAIVGITLTDESNVKPGQINVQIGFGAPSTSWFGGYPHPYCDTLCNSDNIEGVYLPTGAIIGSGFDGFGSPVTVSSDFDYSNYDFDINLNTPGLSTSGVPEPATWALSMLGFGLLGYRLRRRRLSLTA
jgi:hypothetical protein